MCCAKCYESKMLLVSQDIEEYTQNSLKLAQRRGKLTIFIAGSLTNRVIARI